MANRYLITLTQSERDELTALTRRSTANGKTFSRARALLLSDAGECAQHAPWRVAEVAQALGITSRTIEHLKQQFVEEGLEAALGRKPPSSHRPIIFDGAFDARVTALACSDPPQGYRRWTVRLLAERVVELEIAPTVSTMTIQRSLKKTRCALT